MSSQPNVLREMDHLERCFWLAGKVVTVNFAVYAQTKGAPPRESYFTCRATLGCGQR
jgi:hypothetical protein